jgi:antitoxin component of RelBE/YafQ-DinJ toxin-antitoxin module
MLIELDLDIDRNDLEKIEERLLRMGLSIPDAVEVFLENIANGEKVPFVMTDLPSTENEEDDDFDILFDESDEEE